MILLRFCTVHLLPGFYTFLVHFCENHKINIFTTSVWFSLCFIFSLDFMILHLIKQIASCFCTNLFLPLSDRNLNWALTDRFMLNNMTCFVHFTASTLSLISVSFVRKHLYIMHFTLPLVCKSDISRCTWHYPPCPSPVRSHCKLENV